MGEATNRHKTKAAMSMEECAVIVVAGPTASGKSALAVDLARDFDGVVINADSMQVYRDLPILTAQPDAAQLAAAPHRLYGALALDDACTAARWAAMALAEIHRAQGEAKLPILVGGTGLYLKALAQGLSPIPEVPQEQRAVTHAVVDEIGSAELHRRLAEADPEIAAKLQPNDRQRVMRAWDVLQATGKSLAWWQKQPGEAPQGAAGEALRFRTHVVLPARDALYEACERRFDAMLAAGALDEVRAAAAKYPAAKRQAAGFKALGFRELAGLVAGETSLEAATQGAKQATRNYAKRQLTWFRYQVPDAIFLSPDAPAMKFSQSYHASLRQNIRDFLLTVKQ
jgi:tRNA dimethylallyltransferase